MVLVHDRNTWLSAAHIPGKGNGIADFKSRTFQDNKEWYSNPYIFQVIIQHFYVHLINLFAGRLNNKVEKFVSYQPKPGSWASDAFSLNWSSFRFYCFPPFSIIG